MALQIWREPLNMSQPVKIVDLLSVAITAIFSSNSDFTCDFYLTFNINIFDKYET